MPESPGSGFGKYTLKRSLAKGGMGEIFLAEVPGIAGSTRTVVLKKILRELAEEPGFVRRFVAEAQLTMSLQHGNIVQVFETGDVNGSLYMAMEYVDGLDLRQLLKECKKREITPPIEWVVWTLSHVASALDYAHSRVSSSGDSAPVIHRDLSPSNIMLSRDGAVKLLDFGVASVSKGQEQSLSGTLRGKIRYMAPEQANGNEVRDSTDVWALGIVGVEMLLGRPLFTGMGDLDLLDTVRKGELPSELPEALDIFPSSLSQLLLSCLKPVPGERPSAEAVQRGLIQTLTRLTEEKGYTEKDAGVFVRECISDSNASMDLADALLLQVPQNPGSEPLRTRTVGIPELDPLEDSGGTPSDHLSWPTAEVTAQQAESVRHLTTQVRGLIAAVVVLVGFNLYTFYEPSSEADPATQTAVEEQPTVKDPVRSPQPGLNEPSSTRSRRGTTESKAPLRKRDGIVQTRSETKPIGGDEATPISLSVRPKDASIYQDGNLLGQGSRTILLEGQASTRIRVRAPGYNARTVSLDASSGPDIRIYLVPVGKGTVQFRFFPANATIRLDGKLLDSRGGNLIQRKLTAGEHTLEVSNEEGERRVRTFTVVEDELVQLGTIRL